MLYGSKKEQIVLYVHLRLKKAPLFIQVFYALTDLSFSLPSHQSKLYIIIPDKREKDVKLQLNRPSVKNSNLEISYILTSTLNKECDALCKYGDSHHIMEKIAKRV